jgi:hypothetical protein
MLPVSDASTTPPRPGTSTSHPPPGEPERVDDDGDRISITDVNGTVARFEMTYSPPEAGEKAKFGPPLRSRIPSAIYLVASVVFGIVTLCAYNAPTSSKLFVWAVEGDRIRPLSVSVIAIVLLVSSVATVLRTHMRGVIVTDDWVEARYLLPLGIPRAKRWGWPQVTRVVIDGPRTGFEMYDGSFERLPEVADGKAMSQLIVHHAGRLRIDVTVLERIPAIRR